MLEICQQDIGDLARVGQVRNLSFGGLLKLKNQEDLVEYTGLDAEINPKYEKQAYRCRRPFVSIHYIDVLNRIRRIHYLIPRIEVPNFWSRTLTMNILQ